MATSELAHVHSEVDRAVQKLENVTATLGATASRMRNETAAKAAAASDGGMGAAVQQQQQQQQQTKQTKQTKQQQQQQQQQAKQQQQQQQQEGKKPQDAGQQGQKAQQQQQQQTQQTQQQVGDADTSTDSSDDGGSAAHAGVVRAAEAAVASIMHSAAHGREQSPAAAAAVAAGEGSGAAEALEKVASTANDTLTAVKQSKVALEAAAAEAATQGRTKAQVGALMIAAVAALCLLRSAPRCSGHTLNVTPRTLDPAIWHRRRASWARPFRRHSTRRQRRRRG